MTPEQELSEDAVRMLATPEVFARGRDYFRQGMVRELVERGNRLHAEVQGSEVEPYHVVLASEGGRISHAECTCPYNWGGLCKHAVAALLAYFQKPDQVQKRPSLEELLAALDRDRLQAILLTLAAQSPELAERIEVQALAPPSPAKAGMGAAPAPQELPSVDPAIIRKQVRAAFRSSGYHREYDYGHAGEIVSQVGQVGEQARPYLDAGDGRGALAILEAVAEEMTDALESLYDDEGEAYGLFEQLGELLAEAILTADLSSSERHQLEKRIQKWQRRGADYGYDGGFEVALYAARQGWDDPALQRVLQGEITERGAWEGEAPACADELADVRLKILERQERWDEYLHLAEAESRTVRYVTILVRRERISEAVQYGLQFLTSETEYLALSRALEAAGASKEALQVAERGLEARQDVSYPTGELARWMRDLAARTGQTERGLQAALIAMRERPTLADFQAVQPLAGERWPEVREELLAQLRRRASPYPSEEIEIYLHEGLLEDAIAAVDASPRHELVERVVDAAKPTHPDWVFRACTHQFDRIADAGKSQYYGAAVQWLEKARDALLAAGRDAEWRSYIQDVIERHKRKYSLRPQLERLR